MKITRINHKKGERPPIPLTVCRVESNEWDRFKQHHYMSEDINKGAKCFLFQWDDVPIGFVALLNQTYKGCNKNDHRISRIVILPSYQGFSLARDIMNFMGGLVKSMGGNLYIKTIHTKMGRFLEKSDKWEETAMNGKPRTNVYDDKAKNRLERPSYCYKYIGEPKYGYEDMMLPIKELRRIKKDIR